MFDALGKSRLGKLVQLKPAEQVSVVSLRILRRLFCQPFGLFGAELDFQRVYDTAGNIVLNRKYIADVAIVLLCPDMGVGAYVDQLSVYAHFATCALNTAFEKMRHTKRIPNLASIAHTTVRHNARTTNDLQVSDLRQLGQNVVLNAIGKKRVLLVVA